MARFMGVEYGFIVVALPVTKILAKQAILLPTRLSLGILGSERHKTPNHFDGSGMAAFTEVKHGFAVLSLFVSKIMAKMAILAAH